MKKTLARARSCSSPSRSPRRRRSRPPPLTVYEITAKIDAIDGPGGPWTLTDKDGDTEPIYCGRRSSASTS